MPTNDFDAFGTEPGANVIDTATFKAAPWRTLGFQDGVADPREANKLWRQTTTMSNILGFLIVAHAGVDAKDDGDLFTLYNNLVAAIQNVATVNSIVTSVFGRTGAIAAQVGDYSAFYDSKGAATAAQNAATVAAQNYTNAFASNASNLSSGTLNPSLLGSGINANKVADGSISNTIFQYLRNVSADIQAQFNLRPLNSQFILSYNAGLGIGTAVFSTGLVLKWGTLVVFQNVHVTYDTPFPNNFWSLNCTVNNSGQATICNTYNTDRNGFNINVFNPTTGALYPPSGSIQVFWIAIGN